MLSYEDFRETQKEKKPYNWLGEGDKIGVWPLPQGKGEKVKGKLTL